MLNSAFTLLNGYLPGITYKGLSGRTEYNICFTYLGKPFPKVTSGKFLS